MWKWWGVLLIWLSGCSSNPRIEDFALDHGAVVRGDPGQKSLALIFTGGDHGQATGEILDILDQHDVKASFFVTGGYLEVDVQRAAIARMAEAGHYVGPHSDTHPLYCPWEDRSKTLVTREFFVDDLGRNIDELRSLGAGLSETPVYFIPPYEWFNEEQVTWAKDAGVQLFNFTPGTGSNRDWIPEGERGFVSSKQIVADVLSYELREANGLNGFLLLFHLGSQRADRMDAELDELVSQLRDRGYRFVRVDELLRGSWRVEEQR